MTKEPTRARPLEKVYVAAPGRKVVDWKSIAKHWHRQWKLSEAERRRLKEELDRR